MTEVTDLKINFDKLQILERWVNWKAQGLEFQDVSQLPIFKILNSWRIFDLKKKQFVGRLSRKDRVKNYLDDNIQIQQITWNWTNPRKYQQRKAGVRRIKTKSQTFQKSTLSPKILKETAKDWN